MNEAIKGQLQIARIIFIGLLIGQFLFYFFIQYIIKGRAVLFNPEYAQHVLYLALPFFIIGSFLLSYYIGKKRKPKFLNFKEEVRKATFYRETVILQGAIIQMANLFAILSALFTFSYLPFMFFTLGLLIFIFFFPTEAKYLRYDKK